MLNVLVGTADSPLMLFASAFELRGSRRLAMSAFGARPDMPFKRNNFRFTRCGRHDAVPFAQSFAKLERGVQRKFEAQSTD